MALIPMWKCDRDETLFDDKKTAEEHDKMLELAANISCWLEKQLSNLSDEHAEAIGLLIANNKDSMLKAFKGKPELLLQTVLNPDKEVDNVTAIAS